MEEIIRKHVGKYAPGTAVRATSEFVARIMPDSTVGNQDSSPTCMIKAGTGGSILKPVKDELGLYEVNFKLDSDKTVQVEADSYRIEPTA
jgi:hypothetical protein